MKIFNEEYKKYRLWGITLFLALSAVVILSSLITRVDVVFSAIGKVISALQAVWIGLIIAYLLSPVVNAMESKLFIPLFEKTIKNNQKRIKGLARAISVALSVILGIAVIAVILMLVIPQVIDSIISLAKQLPGYYDEVMAAVNKFAYEHPQIGPTIQDFTENMYDKIAGWIQNDLLPQANLVGTVTDGLKSAVGVTINFFIGIIISIYLLSGKENFLLQARKLLAAIFTKKTYDRIMDFCSETHHVFGEFISGKIIDSLIVGVLTFILISIFGIPYAVLISVFIGVTNLIPFFGQYIGIIPTALLVFVESPVKGIIYLILIILLMQFDGNIMGPMILGDSIGLKSFWILFSIIFFGGLFGVWGMLVAVPVFAMIYRYISRFTNKHLKKKGLPTEAYAYAAPPKELPKKESKLIKKKKKDNQTPKN